MLGRFYNELESLVHDIEEGEMVVMDVASFKRQSDADVLFVLLARCSALRSDLISQKEPNINQGYKPVRTSSARNNPHSKSKRFPVVRAGRLDRKPTLVHVYYPWAHFFSSVRPWSHHFDEKEDKSTVSRFAGARKQSVLALLGSSASTSIWAQFYTHCGILNHSTFGV